MKIETLERYIKKTSIPYGDLLKRAKKTLNIEYVKDSNGIVIVKEPTTKKRMTLYFEDTLVYEENRTAGLIASEYNY